MHMKIQLVQNASGLTLVDVPHRHLLILTVHSSKYCSIIS